MKIKYHLKSFGINKQQLLLVVVLAIISALTFAAILLTKNTNIVYPLLIIFFPAVFVFKYNTIRLTYLNAGFVLIFLAEFFALVFSGDFLNSFEAFNRFLVILLLYFFYLNYSKEFGNFKIIRFAFFVGSVFLMLSSIISFLLFKNEVLQFGFADLTQFKHLYYPLARLKMWTFTNFWASALLIFLALNTVYFFRQKTPIFKIVVAAGIFLNIFCVLTTFSRGVYLALFIFWMLSNLFLLLQIPIRKLLLANLVFFAMLWFSTAIIGKPVQTTLAFSETASQQRSTSGRFVVWEKALEMVTDKAVFGQGQKNYKIAFEKNPVVAEDTLYPVRTNNTYLQLLIERGIFGVIFYAGFALLILFLFIKNIKNKKRNPDDRISLILIFAGITAFGVRDLTFSTFFDNDMVYFLCFYLIFNLVPFDISFITIKTGKKQNMLILTVAGIFILLVSFLNLAKWQGEKLNNRFVTAYFAEELLIANQMLEKALQLAPEKFELNRHKALLKSKNALTIEIQNENEKLVKVNVFEPDSLKKALLSFEQAHKKRPANLDVLLHLFWINTALKNLNPAEEYISQALQKNPYSRPTLASIFLLKLENNKLDEASETLAKLLRFSPDFLESKLFKNISINYPKLAESASDQAINELIEMVNQGKNAIYKARLARLLFEKNPEKARLLLTEVRSEMPGLNRPWIYLGYLTAKNAEPENAQEFFEKGIFLNPSDYLSLLYYGNFLRLNNENEKAIAMYKRALKNSLQYKTIPYKKNTGLANLDEIYTSEILKDLNTITQPEINTNEIFTFFSSHYSETGNREKGEYYLKLAQKYNYKIYKGEDILR